VICDVKALLKREEMETTSNFYANFNLKDGLTAEFTAAKAN